MNIGFIGAGKVGTTFGRYLKENGLNVCGYSSKTNESAEKAALFTNSTNLPLHELIFECDYIFITTPDDVILSVWNELKHFDLKDKKIFHMSGSLSSEIFNGIKNSGAYGYSLHPLYPFSDVNAYKELSNIYFSVEGRHLNLISDFLNYAKIKYFQISSENKAKYHSAAVFASNYIVCLTTIAKNILIDCGMPIDLEKAVYPLIAGAVNNILNKGIEQALTGPIVRGDSGTVKKHMEALTDYKDIYAELGKVAVSIAYDSGQIGENKKNEFINLLKVKSEKI